MKKVKDKFEKNYLTPKGVATIAAIESGLLPAVNGGWDDTQFKSFWDKFENLLEQYGYSFFKVSEDRND